MTDFHYRFGKQERRKKEHNILPVHINVNVKVYWHRSPFQNTKLSLLQTWILHSPGLSSSAVRKLSSGKSDPNKFGKMPTLSNHWVPAEALQVWAIHTKAAEHNLRSNPPSAPHPAAHLTTQGLMCPAFCAAITKKLLRNVSRRWFLTRIKIIFPNLLILQDLEHYLFF